MAINRLNRDEILTRALDLVDSPPLDEKDRPSGTIDAGALSIGWLQEALDYFHKKFPFSAEIKKTPVTLLKDTTDITPPPDFIQDYKDGILLRDDQGRLRRRALSHLLNQSVGTAASTVKRAPQMYALRNGKIEFLPQADKDYPADLYYYALPAVLGPTDIPAFPDDLILTHYVWLKGQEWHRAIPTGSALAYADQRIAELQKAGVGNEAEEDIIPLDAQAFGVHERDRFAFPFSF